MIRVQAQLTDEQRRALKRIAADEGVSVAELLRRGADLVISSGQAGDPDSRRERALAAVGLFADDDPRTAADHDRHLSAAFGA